VPVTVVTAETFRARFPEFDGVPDSRLYLTLEEAEADVADRFGDARTRLVAFLAAHRLAVTDAEGGASQVANGAAVATSVSVDGVSISHAIPANLSFADAELYSTHYGQRFIDLRNRFVVGPHLVG